jgi:hypothetical protein
MPIDLKKMEATRVQPGRYGADALVDPNAAIKKASADLLRCIAKAALKSCIGCQGGGWVDKHDMGCAVEALEEASGAYIHEGSCSLCGDAFARITYTSTKRRAPGKCDDCLGMSKMEDKPLRKYARSLIARAQEHKTSGERGKSRRCGKLAKKAVAIINKRSQ